MRSLLGRYLPNNNWNTESGSEQIMRYKVELEFFCVLFSLFAGFLLSNVKTCHKLKGPSFLFECASPLKSAQGNLRYIKLKISYVCVGCLSYDLQ